MSGLRFLVTGGAGFIGSALVRHLISDTDHEVLCLDKLTYAGSLDSLSEVESSPRYQFVQADICAPGALSDVFRRYQPDVVMHLTAESHVDRSIEGPRDFIQTNIVGTYTLLEVALRYWKLLPVDRKASFRFHHVSTDEVFGDLHGTDELFTEETPYAPSSPHSATKAETGCLLRTTRVRFGPSLRLARSARPTISVATTRLLTSRLSG